ARHLPRDLPGPDHLAWLCHRAMRRSSSAGPPAAASLARRLVERPADRGGSPGDVAARFAHAAAARSVADAGLARCAARLLARTYRWRAAIAPTHLPVLTRGLDERHHISRRLG